MENRKTKFLVLILLVVSFAAIAYQVLMNGQPQANKKLQVEVIDQIETQPEEILSDTGQKEDPNPVACPQVFDPVCGILNGEEKTFANTCEAESAGAEELTPGICSPLAACPNDMSPVCGEVDGEETNFENLCKAEAAGAINIEPGNCSPSKKPQEAIPSCSDTLEQVCGEVDGKKVTFYNQCKAEEGGATNIINGKCPLGLEGVELAN